MKNFKELKIWQKGFQIAVNSFQITEIFPKSEKWGLGMQITKAGVSIPSNIAEGSSRTSAKEYNHFIEISLGSSFELQTQLLISRALNMGRQDLIEQTLMLLSEEEKMLISFSNSLRSK